MKYPKYLEARLQEIESVVKSWPMERVLTDVLSWILQFAPEHYDIALRVINNLNVIGERDLKTALSVAYSKLLRHAKDNGIKISKENTLYMPMGSDGESGAMIAYHFRTINDLSSSYFMSEKTMESVRSGKIYNLVLVDDIIATGEQSGEQLVAVAEKARIQGIKNVYLVTAFGFRIGIDRLRDKQVAEVFSAVEYDDRDTVMNLDSLFYDGLSHNVRQQYKEAISKYYGGYGYCGTNGSPIGGLITFYYNTPNCTLSMIWAKGNGWIPLFERKSDANVKKPEFYTPEEFLETKNEKASVTKDECAIYVEGKTEELFIQELANRNNNFGYKTLSILSIGPFVSESLVNALLRYSKLVYFVTDDDLNADTPHVKIIKDITKGKGNLISMGNTLSYFDIEKIRDSEYFVKVFGKDFITETEDKVALYNYLENRLIRKAPAVYRLDNMRELLDHCLLEDNANKLIKMFQKEDSEIEG